MNYTYTVYEYFMYFHTFHTIGSRKFSIDSILGSRGFDDISDSTIEAMTIKGKLRVVISISELFDDLLRSNLYTYGYVSMSIKERFLLEFFKKT